MGRRRQEAKKATQQRQKVQKTFLKPGRLRRRRKEVAAMASFDIFLAILCFFVLSQVCAKSKHYLIETKDHRDDDPRLKNLNRYGKWPPTTKWPEPATTWPETTTTTTWTTTTTTTTTTTETTTTTTWTTTTTTWTTTPPPTTHWTTTPHWEPTPSKWKNNAKDEDDLAE